MAQSARWVVTASGDRPLREIEQDLRTAGFEVEEVLSAIGSVIGSASDQVAKKARSISGVTDVSPEPPPVDIGPPDAPIS